MSKIDKYVPIPLKDLPGVGVKTLKLLHSLKCYSFFDLLLYFPSRYIIKQFEPERLGDIEEGKNIAVSVCVKKVFKKEKTKFRKLLTTVRCCTRLDEEIELVFFNYFPDYIFNNLKLNDEIIVSGKLSRNLSGSYQIMHPKIYRTFSQIKKIDAVYPLISGLSSLQLSKIILACIARLKDEVNKVEEWLSQELIQQNHWLDFIESISMIHDPKDEKDLIQLERLKERIAFDELLANQLAIRLSRRKYLYQEGSVLKFSGELADRVLKSTNMTLTHGQSLALNEIKKDQKSSKKMVRLLQGDVGSGKTLVALLASLNVVESGYQAALMVPTDILSKQHFNLISSLLKPFDVAVELLTGATTKAQRKKILNRLILGEIDILIGTHALFQKDVEFKSLKFVIIDEQHRFGVQQRFSLMNKNKDCDVLAMSATPIPRTLSLIMYGDMEVSTLKDKPLGRIPIKTVTTLNSKINLIVETIKQKLLSNEKIFWVCPLIEQKEEEIDSDNISKKNNMTAAVERFNFLQEIFGDKVGLVHGKLKDSEKEQIMNEFANGKIDILVATTVVEVGIDVPDATMLIIEQANRFGLSQLHQLRGRIGRGNKASTCVLMFDEEIGYVARKRLRTIKNSGDGFYIAEQDLKLRGGGEILGSKQSGLAEFKTVDFEKHYHLFNLVPEYADKIMKEGNLNKYIPLMKIFGYHISADLINA
ncbi:MAG: ATP-dependent DNA helicase RecG [Rickettsiales bacterium]|nr:ATP-dependent DNA helicase RecG [Rickettsiales bacterium]